MRGTTTGWASEKIYKKPTHSLHARHARVKAYMVVPTLGVRIIFGRGKDAAAADGAGVPSTSRLSRDVYIVD